MGFTTGMFGVVGGGNGGLKNGVVEHKGPCPVRLEVVPVGDANKGDVIDEVGNVHDLLLVGSALVVSTISVNITT